MINKLDFLARKYGTDKRTNDQGQTIYHGYAPIYYKYLAPKKFDIKNLLEIGVREGWSHYMWADFLPNSTIYGIDDFSDPFCTISKEEIERNKQIKIIVGDQSDKNVLHEFREIPLDIIIDDGSHMSWHQQKSFNILWEYLVPGGYYFIEDLAVCSIRKFREFDDMKSSTLTWLNEIKDGRIPFCYYIDGNKMKEIFKQIKSINIIGELAIIEKN